MNEEGMMNEDVAFCFHWLRDLGFVWYSDWSMIKRGYIVSFDPAWEVWTMSDCEYDFMASKSFDHVLAEIRYLKLN